MSTIKPVVNEQSISRLLAGLFPGPVTGLRCIEGGLIAQTFVFRTGERDYVIRFNADNMDANFEKEKIIAVTYGLFDGHGQGFFPDWSSNLTFVKDEERADGFFGKWHGLFETSFLDRQRFDRVYGHMEALLPCCPGERSLIHGGYGFGNLLVNRGRITTVGTATLI